MSCYIRHLDFVLERLGWENNKENRKKLDMEIRKVLGMEDKHCPEIWAKVKEILKSKEKIEELVEKLAV